MFTIKKIHEIHNNRKTTTIGITGKPYPAKPEHHSHRKNSETKQ
jgi:hypothetical protein